MINIIIKRKFAISVLIVIICICSFMYFGYIPKTGFTMIESRSFNYQEATNGLTLVIDPGHGGADGGAVSRRGTIESTINLEISLRLEQLCAFLGKNTVLTRNSEDIVYPDSASSIREKKRADQKARIDLINQTYNAVVISIHQNCYTSAGPSGAQVFFAPVKQSNELAEYIQESLILNLDSTNRRNASKISKDIYLMNNINCPAVLIECGFISNPNEEVLLKSVSYQKKIAAIIAASYAERYESLKENKPGDSE